MNFPLFISFCAHAVLLAEVAAARRIPRGVSYYHHYAGQTQEPRHYATRAPVHTSPSSGGSGSSSPAVPVTYQKYTECVPRTFRFDKCSLCFCTDNPMLALCWDYKDEECLNTQTLVDMQTGKKNNDPNGVW